MKRSHELNPMRQETRDKQRKGRLGKKHTQESKDKIRQAKNVLYASPEGELIKKTLSRHTARQHTQLKLTKSKRHGLYFSKKNNALRAYQSSYELLLCVKLEDDKSVKSYDTQVYYEVDERGHSLDFLIHYWDSKILSVEVKPKDRLTEQVNIIQIADSRLNAERNGWEFDVYTEDYFGMTYKEIRDWADRFRATLDGIDRVAHRRKKNVERSMRHYQKHIATDQEIAFCEFCDDFHVVLRKTFEANIARNGRYICEKEGGHIAGSKPKLTLRKINPYAAEGKKECTNKDAHDEPLPFSAFSPDPSRRDGLCSCCKECRAKAASERYERKKK